MFSSFRTVLFPVSLAIGLLASGSASAELIQWTNASGDNLWSNPDNWNLGRVPNDLDNVIADAAQGWIIVKTNAYCATIDTTAPVQINGPLNVAGGANFNGGIVMYLSSLNPVLNLNGSCTIGSFFNTFEFCHVNQPFNGTLTLQPSCISNFYTGTSSSVSFHGGSIINKGSITVEAGGFSLGNAYEGDPLTVFTNDAGGTVYYPEGGNVWDLDYCPADPDCPLGGPAVILNYGSWAVAGGGEVGSKIGFSNFGSLTVTGGTLSIPELNNVDAPSSPLYWGSFYITDGGYLATSGADITSLPPDVSVYLHGPGAGMDGLARVNNIQGDLIVDGGATLQLAPYSLGAMNNHGKLAIGPGSTVSVLGTYTQHADGLLDIVVADATPAGQGMLQGLFSMVLDGTLQVDFYNTDLLTPGAEFPVAALAPDACCVVEGAFDTLNVFPPDVAPTVVEYETTMAKLVVDDGTSDCPADFDSNGSVDGADLGMLLAAWETPAGDLNGDNTTDGADLGLLLSAWGDCL
jgi:hypothetical protein